MSSAEHSAWHSIIAERGRLDLGFQNSYSGAIWKMDGREYERWQGRIQCPPRTLLGSGARYILQRICDLTLR